MTRLESGIEKVIEKGLTTFNYDSSFRSNTIGNGDVNEFVAKYIDATLLASAAKHADIAPPFLFKLAATIVV